MSFDLAVLPREFPRAFVPAKIDLGDWTQIEPLFNELERRPIDTREALERWLLDWSELSAAIRQEGSVRRILMTCQTDDPERERSYFHFVEHIVPRLAERQHRLNVRYVQSPARKLLPRERYTVLDRKIENATKIFREENIPLQTQETKTSQKYIKLMGAVTVQFDGREQTLQQMGAYQEDPNREKRQKAWELVAERRLRERDTLNKIYDELIELRQKIARNAGFANFRDYAFSERERFEYTPEDCFAYHEAVERWIVPLMRDLQEARRRRMGLGKLCPWDLSVDPEGHPPMRPFKTGAELSNGAAAIFDKLDPELASQFRNMIEFSLLDLENRKGKAPGGYQSFLNEHRLPFIFMNAVGLSNDVRTMLHEAGHAFHSLAARTDRLLAYRHAPLEFCEVASMSMELLSAPYWEVFYAKEEAKRARYEHLEGIVKLLPWIARIDAFQHWVYTHPGHAVAERENCWVELYRRFGGIESWDGYESALRNEWHRQLHLFTGPFYYIEYGIAQLGALGLWEQSRKDAKAALQAYRRALALGGSRPLSELFAAAELPFDFGEKTISRMAKTLRAELLPS
ncbi:M3 family oligoendopeptidase [Candidatus Acetothermia bacterium]|nr:M3 family oligoendopeptidase [Candidatus Acetothermia bacterium]